MMEDVEEGEGTGIDAGEFQHREQHAGNHEPFPRFPQPLDRDGAQLDGTPLSLERLARVDLSARDPRLSTATLEVVVV